MQLKTQAPLFVTAYRNINFKLLLVLLLTSLIPLLYSTTRTHFLGNIPDPWTFSIAAQIAWLNVIYEVLSEALLLPLAFLFGQVIHENEKYNARLSTGLSIVVAAYAIATIAVITFTPQMVAAMQQQAALMEQTIGYIRLESIAILMSSVFSFASLVLVLNNKQKLIYQLLLIQTLLTLFCDSLFVSQMPISLNLGVNGVAWTNIIVSGTLSSVAIFYLAGEGLSLRSIQFRQQAWLINWVKVGAKSGLESFVRNSAFLVMILQLINQVQQAGVFWIANQFIWGWLLLPILALGQLVKRDAANHGGMSQEKMNCYLLVVLLLVCCWFFSIPAWQPFIEQVMGVNESQAVTRLVLLMLGFYIVFSFNHMIDSYFYGIGRTDLMLYQSLIVNICFYGCAFIAYQTGLFIPSLNKIAIMFGLGIAIDAFITAYLYYRLAKNNLLRISSR